MLNEGEGPPIKRPLHKQQVYLGPEITVEVTGQRALAILSRGSLILNTSITAEPSTLGGFPGGGGVARDPGGGELLLSPPSVPPEFDLSSLANGTLGGDVASYNVNGPGSASYRYYLFTITTSADDVDEVQRVRLHICEEGGNICRMDQGWPHRWLIRSTSICPHLLFH